ncbi:hypothetical protein H4C81_19475 [Pseudomonas monteilii]|uniref:endonuclease/exonuclease/phosphatase family protein n=1 Tax=Pseudomonas monteilii TaxID=76759 RepID=UPI0015F872CD|nr:hypothetical protein [Pseudomonas monteilii]MBA6091047.1 hypothetical protein [Pseudomonas monteilii]
MYIFSSKDVTSKRGNSVLKVAKQIHAIVEDSTAPFHIYISHWPSRLWCHQHDADRHLLGIRLRDSLNNLMEETTTKPFVVLLGDYNDEPFDESLSHQLMASRDLDLVHKRQHLLYNPFWKYLSKIKNEHTFAGSYYYKGGEVTRWHTFDQVIFSHAFIEGKEWRLSNDCEHIIEFPPYTQLVKDPDSKFDHLPVYGTIERVKDHG